MNVIVAPPHEEKKGKKRNQKGFLLPGEFIQVVCRGSEKWLLREKKRLANGANIGIMSAYQNFFSFYYSLRGIFSLFNELWLMMSWMIYDRKRLNSPFDQGV